jgi:hypothetical protein
MHFNRIPINPKVTRIHEVVERTLNRGVRSYDAIMGALHLGGRKANYDDHRYEFVGGPGDSLRKQHYDKSLRLLWKAEEHAEQLSFRDCTSAERALLQLAERELSDEENRERTRYTLPEFKALLDREYTREEKQAIVNILSSIGHGEAYAWLVSAELLAEVKSTGARAALTMQVFEEAKHFTVLRELLQAFEVPIPRQSAWEYMFLEGVFKANGLEKLFGMNTIVEGIALGVFGLLSHLPGLEILRLFHRDESRHTAMPSNYLKEFPLTALQSRSPIVQLRRLKMILPAFGLIPYLEADMAVLGIDVFDFGGAVLRKVSGLAERIGFRLPIRHDRLMDQVDALFNAYCRLTRSDHEQKRFTESETTRGDEELELEREVFGTGVRLA